ncbi:hypothetical protein ACIHFD_65000 [Nonomuraea sp. NPDC051941]|uniref:hypothetical protein n=1 Tax=Nonomuraea sp. NPDC051941 TaxID=3364373 RepID=UPI0037CCA28D
MFLVAASAHTGALDAAHVSATLTGSSILLTTAFLTVVIVIVPARRTPLCVPANSTTDTAV